jgi:Putative  PD-(D/E)XK family member, (DUF4420)
MTETFIARWRQILDDPGAGKSEVDASHPLRFIFGVDQAARPLLFVITAEKPPMPDLSGVIAVDRGQRTRDGMWTLSLTLTDNRFLDTYLQFASDLVNRTSAARTESEGLIRVLTVVNEWKRLFTSGTRALLGETALRGVIAELWFGFRVLVRQENVAAIAKAWKGPLGGDQDFVFAFGRRYEVKSLHVDSDTIRISSAEQLDAEDLTLASVTLEECGHDHAGALSLPTIVAEIRQELADGPDAAVAFDQCLSALGADVGDSHYADRWFAVKECIEYTVTPEFPAIRRSTIPAGITLVVYDIAISMVTRFETTRTPGLIS